MSNYDFSAKRKPGRPKRVLSVEEGTAQIMAVINGDTLPETTERVPQKRTTPEEAKAQLRSDMMQAADFMKDASKHINAVFAEARKLRVENEKLHGKVEDLKAEIRELSKWRDIGEMIKKTLLEEE